MGEIGVVAPDIESDPPLVDETPVESRGASLLKDGGEELEGGRIRGRVVGNVIADVDDRSARIGLVDLDASLAELGRFHGVHGRRRGPAGDPAEGLAHAREHPRRLHVTRHHEEGVVREIVAIVEGPKLGWVDA